MGPELMMQFRDQASRFGAELITAKVTKVDLSGSPFGVWIGDEEHRAESIIVATGAQSLMLGLEVREPRSSATGCPPARPATASSSAATRSASSAAATPRWKRRSSSRSSRARSRSSTDATRYAASKIMQDRARANEKIEFLWDTVVTDLVGDNKLEAVQVENLKTGAVVGARAHRSVRRDRPRAQHAPVQGPVGHGRCGVLDHP